MSCNVFNKNYEDGTTDNVFRTKWENSTELWANDAFERYGSGLDQSGNVEHHVWKEHILTGDTDRLEESGLPGPDNRVDDKSTFNAWFKMQEKQTNGKVTSAAGKTRRSSDGDWTWSQGKTSSRGTSKGSA